MISQSALIMFGIQNKMPDAQEKQWLQSPLTAGVILFTRNYENPKQLRQLIQCLRKTAKHDILIAVDHEGGRVQRFKTGFSRIPAMAELGKIYDQDKTKALRLACQWAKTLASELAACDIDFSFAPVLDMQTTLSKVIGDRAFHADPAAVAELASAFCQGLNQEGMIAVGKHFPGHGHVVADSHDELPICYDEWPVLAQRDLAPFAELIKKGIAAIMPAHVVYQKMDSLPAGFSDFWLQKILRQQLGFEGCIISDDLDMAGAVAFGDVLQRVALAQKNCDLLLLCNQRKAIQTVFEQLPATENPKRQARLQQLKRR